MKKILIFWISIILIIIGVFAVLGNNGYLFVNHTVIPPISSVELEKINDDTLINITNSNFSSNDYNIFYNLTNKINELKGIENIEYKIFISNETIEDIKNFYRNILRELGYDYYETYSDSIFYDSNKFNYYTFIKGFNGVVIFMTSYNEFTWICYSTGHVFDYQVILDNINR
jgi:hypothetical protein